MKRVFVSRESFTRVALWVGGISACILTIMVIVYPFTYFMRRLLE